MYSRLSRKLLKISLDGLLGREQSDLDKSLSGVTNLLSEKENTLIRDTLSRIG